MTLSRACPTIVNKGLIEVWDKPGLGITFNVPKAKAHLTEEDRDFFDEQRLHNSACPVTLQPGIRQLFRRFGMAESSEYISAVNGVIGICKDAEQGFQGAATAVKDPELKALFTELSRERAGFARELQALVESSGHAAAHPAGIAGTAHEAWIRLKGALTGHSAHQILEETERGEDLSLKRYREALSHALPDSLKTVIDRQYQAVQSAHNRIKLLRDRSSGSSTSAGAAS